ncbi:glycine reductase [Facklamia miroungae]|nr:glycine reductase [Facklamia miroungae]
MATIITISQSVGANRIVPTVAIPHPTGDPSMEREDEEKLRMKMVERAVNALSQPVTEVTVF